MDAWLPRWEFLYEECISTEVPEVQRRLTALYDFLLAIKLTNTSFYEIWYHKIVVEKDQDTTFHELVRTYRRQHGTGKDRTKTSKVSFATFHGQEQPEPSSNLGSSNKKKPLECPVCGARHRIAACWYANPDAKGRPPNWIPNREKRAEVEERLRTDPSLKNRVEDSLRSWRESQNGKDNSEKKDEESFLAFFTIGQASPESLRKCVERGTALSTHENPYRLRDSWILDSGTSCHICNDRNRFISFTPAKDRVKTGDSYTEIEGYGDVRINVKDATTGETFPILLLNTQYSPKFHTNLVSCRILRNKGYRWDPWKDILVSEMEGKRQIKVEEHDGMWTLEHNKPSCEAYSVAASSKPVVSKASADIWHRRLGHLYAGQLDKLAKMVDGMEIKGPILPTKDHDPELCETCQLTKARRQISRRVVGRSYGRFGRVHFDLVQISEGYNGDRWMTHFYVEGIRLHAVYTHRRKNGVQKAVRAFTAMARNVWGLPIKAYRYDNERAAGNVVEDYLEMEGIVIEHSTTQTPEQNSYGERSGGVIIERARALLIDSNLPKELWPEAVRAAAYLINRSPTYDEREKRWIIP